MDKNSEVLVALSAVFAAFETIKTFNFFRKLWHTHRRGVFASPNNVKALMLGDILKSFFNIFMSWQFLPAPAVVPSLLWLAFHAIDYYQYATLPRMNWRHVSPYAVVKASEHKGEAVVARFEVEGDGERYLVVRL